MSNTVEFLKWILVTVFGTGWVGTFLFYKSRKRKSNAEAREKELNVSMLEIEHLRKSNAEAYAQIEKLQEIIDQLREDTLKKGEAINDLKMRLLQEKDILNIAEYNRCEVEDCCNRIPERKSTYKKYGKEH